MPPILLDGSSESCRYNSVYRRVLWFLHLEQTKRLGSVLLCSCPTNPPLQQKKVAKSKSQETFQQVGFCQRSRAYSFVMAESELTLWYQSQGGWCLRCGIKRWCWIAWSCRHKALLSRIEGVKLKKTPYPRRRS